MKTVLLSMCLALPFAYCAQNTFQRSFGTPESNELFGARYSTDGNILLTGYAYAQVPYIFICKLDPSADTIWSHAYFCPDYSKCNAIKSTCDNGAVICTRAWNYSSGSCVFKIDSLGNVAWAKQVAGNSIQECTGVAPTRDHGVAAVLTIATSQNLPWKIATIKFDSTGNVSWQKYYYNNIGLRAWNIDTCSDGGFVITGALDTLNTSNTGYLLLRLNNAGNPMWVKWIGSKFGSEGYAAIELHDGGFAVTGYANDSIGPNSINYHGMIAKTDSNGDLIWTKTVGTTAGEDAYDVVETNDHGLAITGSTTGMVGNNLYSSNTYMCKFDSSSNTLWTKFYGGNGNANDWSNTLELAPDGGFLVAGSTGYNVQHGYLLKTDSNGLASCNEHSYNLIDATGTIHDRSASMMAGPSSLNVQTVTIHIQDLPVINFDVCLTGIDEPDFLNKNASPFPNPSSGIFSFENLTPGNELDICDLTGRVILTKEIQNSAETIDLGENENGIYFYRILNNGSFISQGKLILAK